VTFKATPHKPGEFIQRRFSGYSDYQEHLWEALDDFYFADVGGYGNTRQPTPGKVIEPKYSHQLDFSGWKELVIQRWGFESGRDKNTKGITDDEIPEHLWYYLYERFLDAEQYYIPKSSSRVSYGDSSSGQYL